LVGNGAVGIQPVSLKEEAAGRLGAAEPRASPGLGAHGWLLWPFVGRDDPERIVDRV
jgi:hypothetical protein